MLTSSIFLLKIVQLFYIVSSIVPESP